MLRNQTRGVSTIGALIDGNVRSEDVEARFCLERNERVGWHGHCELKLPWKFRDAWDEGREIKFHDNHGNSVRLVGGQWNPITGDALIYTTGTVRL